VSSLKVCDWCGQPIDERRPHAGVMVLTIGSVTRASFDGARRTERDYHAERERDCFAEAAAAIQLVHEHRAVLRGVA
jgi:hypothetical protein